MSIKTLRTVLGAACLLLMTLAAGSGGMGAPDTSPAGLRQRALPDGTIPDGMGVNIHFWGAPKRDLDLIRAAGFRFVRMDFTWAGTERQRGRFHFAPYDEMVDGLAQRGMRALFILGYDNSLYEHDRCVRSAEGRKAFARWAAVAAGRYRGRGVIWEIWNEPNTGRWKSRAGTREYLELARATATAVRQADPKALVIGPAASGIPLDFLADCLGLGLLEHVDAISVHPYRQGSREPETVEGEIRDLRALMARHRGTRSIPPVIAGEWGYSTVGNGVSEALQGRYLARMFLTNASLRIPLSIWYDWRDDGTDARNPEHHFGLVSREWQPKPAWHAMQRLSQALAGLHFVRRLESGPRHRLLLFGDGRRQVVAAYTFGNTEATVRIGGRQVKLTGDPLYLSLPGGARDVGPVSTESAVPPCSGSSPNPLAPSAPSASTGHLRLSSPLSVSDRERKTASGNAQ